MKTPIAYYGGKQQLASRIIGLIPEHRIYVEPFFGGGAVFWAKEPSEVEIVNDTNGELINFYRVLRQNADALIKEIDATLNSRETYRHAEVVLRNADMFDEVKRAWAVWVVSNMAYCHKWFAGWGYQLSVRQAIANARDRIGGGGTASPYCYQERLGAVQIECGDAVSVITRTDRPETFFYLDPPYPGTDQGHYDGYTQEDFERLLDVLDGIRGKFLLSSFRNRALKEHADANGWRMIEIRMPSSATTGQKQRLKVEVLTANYTIDS